MAGPLDLHATSREIVATRAMVTALGQALVKKGVISHSDVGQELSLLIQGVQGDPELTAEMKHILGVVLTWGT